MWNNTVIKTRVEQIERDNQKRLRQLTATMKALETNGDGKNPPTASPQPVAEQRLV